jgi:hypothetical protein
VIAEQVDFDLAGFDGQRREVGQEFAVDVEQGIALGRQFNGSPPPELVRALARGLVRGPPWRGLSW